jgi:hypothetical protein
MIEFMVDTSIESIPRETRTGQYLGSSDLQDMFFGF